MSAYAVHLPDDWEGEQRGTACGLLFGMPGWLARRETVLTDPEEAADATCAACLTPDKHGNVLAREGCTRCGCGVKYWENDRCTDCGTHVTETLLSV